MSSRHNKELTRIIIEMPRERHTKLKIRAAELGKSMKDIILESLEMTDAFTQPSHKTKGFKS